MTAFPTRNTLDVDRAADARQGIFLGQTRLDRDMSLGWIG